MIVTTKIFDKLGLIAGRYENLRFTNQLQLSCSRFDTREHFRSLPNAPFTPIEPGTAWGDDGLTMWLKSTFRMPAELDGKRVFVRYCNSLAETLFEANGIHKGVFDRNHPVVMLENCAKAGAEYTLGFEAYSGHSVPGCHADEVQEVDSAKSIFVNCKVYEGIWLCTEEPVVTQFVFDLYTLLQQVRYLNDHHLRKGQLAKCLEQVFAVVDALPNETGKESWLPKLAQACEIMKPMLEKHNGDTAPVCITMGHSHIDTAWQWTLDETIRKCARTFSSVLNLMDQYPQFTFVQSAPLHAEWMKKYYPDIFERICQRVAEGRWEPNGAVYVEPDCNLTSGESLARQLIFGQKTTREFFGYTSDTLWLPDTFGYSVALPQLLRLANVNHFCTTKIYWNDTNRFPYDTFTWKGLDGSSVTANFHKVHFHPNADQLENFWIHIVQHKDVQDRILAPFGFGDGGGGPMNEMIEEAARLEDLEGAVKTHFGTVSEFMNSIDTAVLPVFNGELYLECHRGTLTSVSPNKKGNRMCEIALRTAEYLAAVQGGEYPKEQLDELWKMLLINQFHDILPGTSIPPVNHRAQREFTQVYEGASQITRKVLEAEAAEDDGFTVVNTLSWDYCSPLKMTGTNAGEYAKDLPSQRFEDRDGGEVLLVGGVHIPATGSVFIPMADKPVEKDSPFTYENNVLTTPFAVVTFGENGTIVSLKDRNTGREYVAQGGSFNSFIVGEDVPTYWDNWDINEEQQLKRYEDNRLISRRVVADGPVTLRLESKYDIAKKSTLTQIIAVYADTPRIDFETTVDWQDKHMLLKASFDTTVASETILNETQFGHIARPTHTNYSTDRARFEVPNQKWSDLADNGFGVAILNDCKYGISAKENNFALTLFKSGTHPDAHGDEGINTFTYSLVPHEGGFSVPTVVHPAYELNMPLPAVRGRTDAFDGLLNVSKDSVILETVKQSEDGKAMILRFYEAGKSAGEAEIRFLRPVKGVREVNLLEEEIAPVALEDNAVRLFFRAFEP